MKGAILRYAWSCQSCNICIRNMITDQRYIIYMYKEKRKRQRIEGTRNA